MEANIRTGKEEEVLNAIVHNEFQDFPGKEEVIGNSVWSECIYCNVTGKALSGVISSLMKKELVDGFKDREGNQLWVTKKGFEAYKTLKKAHG